MHRFNNEIRIQFLQIEGIEESLADIIYDTYQYLKKLKRKAGNLDKKLKGKSFEVLSFDELIIFINKLLLEYKIKEISKKIDSLCYAHTDSLLVLDFKDSYRKKWQDPFEEAQKINIEDVVRRYIPDANYRRNISCPFHDDKSPSMKIYPDTNSFYCFSCCKGGNHINFVMEIENCDFKEAVRRLLNQ